MFYGVDLPITLNPRVLGELARLAEDSGWDGVFVEDYIVHHSARDAPTYDPWVALSAIALATKRLRLGTMITPMPRRRPWKVAREAVSVDHLSNGRLILGVGIGHLADPGFGRVGEETDARVRAERLDEALQILEGLWSGRPFSFEGKHFRVSDLTMLPQPVQQPRIPIWVGARWPVRAPIERAARWDGVVADNVNWGLVRPSEVQALKTFVEARRPPAAPFDIVVGANERRADWDEERDLINGLAQAGATWWTELIPHTALDEIKKRISSGP